MNAHVRRPAARDASQRGFSLIELVIVLGLLGVVVAVMFSQLTTVQRGETFERGRAEALDDMRLAMSRMTREIRQAYNVVPTPTASSLTVDTYVQGVPTRVVYDVSGTSLTRKVGSVTSTLQTGLADTAIFDYEPSADVVQVVHISLSVHPPNLPDTTVRLESEVRLRNREG